MKNAHAADAAVAKLLACLPTFRRWSNRPLSPTLKKLLREADEQTLMSLAVHALHRAVKDDPELFQN